MKIKNKSIRKLLAHLVIVSMLSIFSLQTKAQVIEVITTGATITEKVYKAVTWIAGNMETVRMIFRGFRYKHRWWACIYQDGFVTFNNFRSYRTSMDAYNYFVLGHGDCDAVYGSANNKICYESPLQAKKYSEQHGPVVDIQYQDDSGTYHSIYDY